MIWNPDKTSGSVLAVLVEAGGRETSLADLARATGMSAPTVMREADRLANAGLVRESREGRERRIAIDKTSPYYGPIEQLIFIVYGTRPRLQPEGYESGWLNTLIQDTYVVENLELRSLIPEPLRAGWRVPELPDEQYDGPELPAARAWILRLQPFAQRAGRIEQWLQRTYHRWNDERDRDLIHLTLNHQPLAAGTQQAITVLTRAVAARVSSSDHPAPDIAVGRLAWAHAVYCLHAEAQICERVANYFDEVNTLVAPRRGHLQSITTLRGLLQRNAEDTDGDQGGFVRRTEDEIRQHEAAIDEIEKALVGKYRIGGTPPVEAVGNAGERLLAVEARLLADEAAQLATEMAAHESFVAWVNENPTIVEQHPRPAPGR
jgi:DNA-binding transcriptional ArsR family regulator